MAAYFVCQTVSMSVSESVCQTFSIHFMCRSYLFNARMDQVHMWYAYALYYVENIIRVGLLVQMSSDVKFSDSLKIINLAFEKLKSDLNQT